MQPSSPGHGASRCVLDHWQPPHVTEQCRLRLPCGMFPVQPMHFSVTHGDIKLCEKPEILQDEVLKELLRCELKAKIEIQSRLSKLYPEVGLIDGSFHAYLRHSSTVEVWYVM